VEFLYVCSYDSIFSIYWFVAWVLGISW